MTEREKMERLLADLSRRREQAEASAARAARELARMASGLTPLQECDAEKVRASADEFASALERLHMLAETSRMVRELLM